MHFEHVNTANFLDDLMSLNKQLEPSDQHFYQGENGYSYSFFSEYFMNALMTLLFFCYWLS